jgi:hypothetical protein
MDESVDYKRLYEDEKKKSEKLAKIIDQYEMNGATKLFYSINRKSNEMANLLNANPLDDVNVGDKDSKSFERIFKILEKCETIANSIKSLGEIAGVTGDEEKDLGKRMFTSRLAAKRPE